MARTAIISEAQWLAARAKCLGGSEIACLFGVGFQTPFQLHHQKKGSLPPEDFSDNERVRIGHHLEPAIASLGAEQFHLKLVKATAHYTDDSTGGLLGATPDYWLDHEDSDTVVEIKNASWGAFKDDWIIHEDGFTECPLRYQLQVQAQLACTGAKHGILLALISGDRLVQCHLPRHETAIAEIRSRVTAFYENLAAGIEPPADMPADMQAASRVWSAGTGNADMRGDTQIEGWLHELADLRVMERQVTGEIERVRGNVMAYCASNNLAAITANAGRISYKWREPKEARVVERAAQPGRNELRITTA